MNKIDPSDYVYSESVESYSEWENRNNVKAVFRLLTHEKRTGRPNAKHMDSSKCQASVFLRVEIEPGQRIKLKSEYDQAIRKLDPKTGQIVGGLCPWLTKIGEEDVVVHKSLDYQYAIQNELAGNMLETLRRESDMRDAMKELERRKVQMQETGEIPKNKVGRPRTNDAFAALLRETPAKMPNTLTDKNPDDLQPETESETE